jgi:hypothetical protein
MAKDGESVEGRLAALSPVGRALFAAGCAERVVEFYRLYDAETGREGYAVLRRVLDAVWASAQGSVDLAGVERQVGAVVPDVDVDRAEHAGVANVVGMVVLCAARARATGAVDDAVRAADHVDELLEHQFGASDLAAYHRELDKLRGLPPAELIPKANALNRRGTRNPARKKAERRERAARERLLEVLEAGGVDAEEVREVARAERLPVD